MTSDREHRIAAYNLLKIAEHALKAADRHLAGDTADLIYSAHGYVLDALGTLIDQDRALLSEDKRYGN